MNKTFSGEFTLSAELEYYLCEVICRFTDAELCPPDKDLNLNESYWQADEFHLFYKFSRHDSELTEIPYDDKWVQANLSDICAEIETYCEETYCEKEENFYGENDEE